MRKPILLASAAFLFAGPAFALDKGDQDALKNTQDLLANPAAIQEMAKTDPNAKNALSQVNDFTRGNAAQNAEVNAISSSVFADMVKGSNGDAAAIQDKLQNALKDPAAFVQTLSPEQQQKIRGLASQIESQGVNLPAAAPAAKK